MPEPTSKFKVWAVQANEAYSRQRAAYREQHPISDLEQLWKPTTASELVSYLRRRPTGRYKVDKPKA